VPLRTFFVDHYKLQPNDLWLWIKRERLVHRAARGSAVAEDIDHIDRLRDPGKRLVNRGAKELRACNVRVDA